MKSQYSFQLLHVGDVIVLDHSDAQSQYSFLETWQKSLDFCRSQNGTLLTIKDDEEADFIKVKL